jgi:hypothetical protein
VSSATKKDTKKKDTKEKEKKKEMHEVTETEAQASGRSHTEQERRGLGKTDVIL